MNKRIIDVILSGGRTFLTPLLNFIVSALVVRYYSTSLWGEFIGLYVTINLFSAFLSWGHTEPLIRAFSQQVDNVSRNWYKWFWNRQILMLLPLIYFLFICTINSYTYVILSLIFIQYVSQSFQVLITFKKHFKSSFFIEVFAGVIYVLYIFLNKEGITLMVIFQGLILHFLFKISGYIILFWRLLKNVFVEYSLDVLKEGFPFFLVVFSGFLNSRIDVFFMQYFVLDDILGQYHVVMNFLIQGATLIGIVLMPISKYIYRLSYNSYTRLLQRMIFTGIFIGGIIGVGIPFVLKSVYLIDIGYELVMISVIYITVSFSNPVMIYYLFKHKKENKVLFMNYFGVSIHALLLFIFGRGGSVMDYLQIVCCVKLLMFGVYFVTFKARVSS